MTGKESRTSPRQDTERTADSAKRIVRVLHLIAGNFYGGPERQIIGLARAIDKSRYEVVVAAFSEAGRETELIRRAKQEGIPAETIFVRNAYDLRAPKRIANLIDRCKIDILNTHGYRSNLLGRRAARIQGIKHLAVSRGWTAENIKVRLYHWLDRTTLKKSDTVVCVSQSKKGELLRAGVPREKLIVIPNAVFIPPSKASPTIDWREKFGWDRTTPLVVCAGRLSYEKGPDLFLSAVPEIVRNVPQARFVIFGDGPLVGRLAAQIEKSNLDNYIRLAGFVTDLPRELPDFDVLVNPSRSEGMPNIILEALAARLAVVATDVGGVSEVIVDGQTGRLVPAADPATLALTVCETLNDKSRAAERAERALQMIRTRFSFAVQADRYENVYDQMLAGEITLG